MTFRDVQHDCLWVLCEADDDARWFYDLVLNDIYNADDIPVPRSELPPTPVCIRATDARISDPSCVDAEDVVPFASVEFRTKGFSIGDRVESLIDDNEGNRHIHAGRAGTVVDLNEYDYPPIGVRWDVEDDGVYWGHTCGGHISDHDPQTGYYVYRNTIAVVCDREFATADISDLFETL